MVPESLSDSGEETTKAKALDPVTSSPNHLVFREIMELRFSPSPDDRVNYTNNCRESQEETYQQL